MGFKEGTKCGVCGKSIPRANVLMQKNDGTWLELCEHCNTLVGTCYTCKSSRCSFQEDTSIPSLIQKTIRQGNVTAVTLEKNLEKVDKHCKDKCPCFSTEFGCGRESITPGCANYNPMWD